MSKTEWRLFMLSIQDSTEQLRRKLFDDGEGLDNRMHDKLAKYHNIYYNR